MLVLFLSLVLLIVVDVMDNDVVDDVFVVNDFDGVNDVVNYVVVVVVDIVVIDVVDVVVVSCVYIFEAVKLVFLMKMLLLMILLIMLMMLYSCCCC